MRDKHEGEEKEDEEEMNKEKVMVANLAQRKRRSGGVQW